MSFLQLKNSSASQLITRIGLKLRSEEPAEGNILPEDYVTYIIKVACILVIGLVILSSIVGSNSMNASDPFYDLAIAVKDQITSGYTLGSLMIMVLGAAAVIRYLGFI
jgi:hypothetical protein